MPGTVSHTPAKRVLVETTNTARNIQASPRSAKKRKLEAPSQQFRKPSALANGPGSSQPKSQFELEVLEKLSQNLDNLKKNNQEKDQHWPRPSLDDFDENNDSLCFQQIEAEEGSLHGGKTTVRLFGVTEVHS
jgi:DNA polymerase delta subunit 1